MVFVKPESALKRANELIAIGKKNRALEMLFDVIKSRRHREWTKTHESLMETFLGLCIDLRKSQTAKDGLHQYKTAVQAISVKSLEDVIRGFLKEGEQRCANARTAATNALVDIEDLEVIQSPESLLLSAVSGESQQDRTDRDMLAPWLKFVWESYKQCLELLKNNNRVERIYQEVAQMGFAFCKQYNRRPEFRRLCDTIRTHFSQSQKYSQQTNSVNLQLPETQSLHWDTRLVQLNTAIEMELWQEAFKAVEYIYEFNVISKRTPKPQQLADYYQKVALVFWKAGNYVFHATTVLKLYVLHREKKKTVTTQELEHLSTKALLAILSIPLPAPRTQIDEHLETEDTSIEKQKRLTSLLSLQNIPTRASLIRDMIKQGVLNYVHPELRDMYQWLEIEFHPLRLSSKMEEGIKFVEELGQPEYSQYMPALRDVTVVRLLQQVSQVYQTIELKRFMSLAPPMDSHRMERIIVNAARNNDVQVHIEHKTQALTFGSDLKLSTGRPGSGASEGGSTANVIQKMPNEQIRNQLISMSRALCSCMDIVNEKANKERTERLKLDIAQTYHRDEPLQRKEILKRRDLTERYKEEKENQYRVKLNQRDIDSKDEQAQREAEEKSRREAEVKRRMAEAALEKEKEEHRLSMKIAIDKLRESEIGRKIIDLIGEQDLYTYDPNSINSLHIDAVIQHSREQKEKLKVQYKKVDYFVRALHEAEIPLLQQYATEQLTKRTEIQQENRRKALEQRAQLLRMDQDKREFFQSIRGQREDTYNEQLAAFNQRLAEEKDIRLRQLHAAFIEKKKYDWRKQRALKKQQIEEEKRREMLAKKERAEREEKERIRMKEDENKHKLDEIARIQKAKEDEIERKMKEQSKAYQAPRPDTRGPTGDSSYTSKYRSDNYSKRPESGQKSQADTKSNWRSDDTRQRNTGDSRYDDSSNSRSNMNNDRRNRFRDDRRPFNQGPTSSNAEKASEMDEQHWRTVERKRPNPPTNINERSSQARTGEGGSSGIWQPRSERFSDLRDSPRESTRGFGASTQQGSSRADTAENWRSREKKRMNSWRCEESDENDQANSSSTQHDRSNENRRPMGSGFEDSRRPESRDFGSGRNN